ncbi:hypothetical protein KY345_03460 [Candidatus Woesearchaeota archaeon]|nr:hypothetical protein [Candidatus Woesearchaeota archaeon]
MGLTEQLKSEPATKKTKAAEQKQYPASMDNFREMACDISAGISGQSHMVDTGSRTEAGRVYVNMLRTGCSDGGCVTTNPYEDHRC